ncbi:MAG: EamA family transporter, partial [Ktedonobacteraceae bacterium]|nr:EamA family transporter [Ktedonobacteraceae bacterium]
PLQRTKLWRRGWQWMRQSAPGIAGGLVAMFGFGVLSLGLGAATAIDGLAGAMAMLISMRLFSVFFLAILASLSGSPSEPHKAPTPRSWIIAGIVGAFEIGGLALFSSTVLLSSTALAGILSSVYPVFPLLYAFLFKRERLSRLQLAGTFCIVVGLGLLSSELPLPLSSSVGGGLLVLLGGIIWFPCLKQLILRMRRRNVGVTTPEMDQVLTETVTILNTFLLFHRAVSPASAKESVGKREAS